MGITWAPLRAVLPFFVFSIGLQAAARMPSNPESDPDFAKLPNGVELRQILVNDSRLSLTKGSGVGWGSAQQNSYLKIKENTLRNRDSKIQWVVMDLDSKQVLAQSSNPDRRIFGASSSKIFVGGTLLDFQSGSLKNSQLQLMANMLVVSSNEAWTTLQSQIGNGNPDKGRERNLAFTQRMGYERTLGFQGSLGNQHGNELTAIETAEFLADTYQDRYPGAEYLWKLMHTCRTGVSRGLKYLPSNQFVGGKTGTYEGPSYDTDLGQNVNVNIVNHVLVLNVKDRQYGLVILNNTGNEESTALLAGGLYREYLAIR